MLGIAGWLLMMLGTMGEAVRAPQAGHVFGNVYFLHLAMSLLGLIFFYTQILTISTVKLSPFLPVSNIPVKVLLLGLPHQLCGFYTGM